MVEVLVISTIGVVALSGSAEFLKVVLSSAKVSNSLLTENDFKQTIAKGLAIDCDEPDQPVNPNRKIKPDNLEGSDKSKGIGDFRDDFTLPGGIKKGDFKDGSIKVIKIKLYTDDHTKPTRDFEVYYKKVGLGKADAPDLSKCTATDQSGCFKHTCTVGYDNDRCETTGLNCHVFSENTITEIQDISKQVIANKSCPANQFLSGFDTNGNAICSPDFHCPEGQALNIKQNTDGTFTKECISAGGSKAVTCPNDGEFLKGFDEEGRPDCQKPCYGGQIYYESIKYFTPAGYEPYTLTYQVGTPAPLGDGETLVENSQKRFCKCHRDKYWQDEVCKTCPSGRKFVKLENACMSCMGGEWHFLESKSFYRCFCPRGYTKKKVVQSILVNQVALADRSVTPPETANAETILYG